MFFKYLFVRYIEELYNMFYNEQLCLSLFYLLKIKFGKKKFFLIEYFRCFKYIEFDIFIAFIFICIEVSCWV